MICLARSGALPNLGPNSLRSTPKRMSQYPLSALGAGDATLATSEQCASARNASSGVSVTPRFLVGRITCSASSAERSLPHASCYSPTL
eukprot:7207231-Pyramimonas_sp.AAC.1